MTIDSLIDKYGQRVPYEERSKESDKKRKRKERRRELKELTVELIGECEEYKRLRLTPYQRDTVFFLVDTFCKDFKMLHGQAKTTTIILAFIFYVKINELPSVKLNEYKVTSKYDLSDETFEIIVCRLAAYFMKRMPIVPRGTTDYDHETLSRNGGRI